MQQMVDHIAVVLGRPALVEDRRQRAVVYSPQSDVIDDVRRTTILQRYAGHEVSSWLHTIGVNRARGPVRTPENTGLKMLPRLCIPIWRADLALGYLWFIEAPGAMSSSDVDLASDLGGRLAEEWYRWRLHQDLTSTRNSGNVRDLLLGSGETMRRAADELVEEGYFGVGNGVNALTVRPVVERIPPPAEDIREGLERTLRTVARGIGAANCLMLVRPDHGVLLVAAAEEVGRGGVDDVAARLSTAADQCLASVPGVASAVIGVGGPRTSLDQAQDSYLDASRAAQIGASFDLPGSVIRWDKLGVYRGLHAIASTGVQPADMQAGFERLLREKDGRELLDTVECYLNLGGHVQDAAAQLNLHRTSLYYRLDRIQRIVGVDLKNGVERLGFHLAIMLERMRSNTAEK
jgi:hypothetical protein